MLGMEIVALDAFELEDPKPYDGVVSLVTFSGDWIGAGMFCCHEQLACQIGSAMLGHAVENIGSDVLDGIGEMANMIIGNLKEQLEARTGPLALSIPPSSTGRTSRPALASARHGRSNLSGWGSTRSKSAPAPGRSSRRSPRLGLRGNGDGDGDSGLYGRSANCNFEGSAWIRDESARCDRVDLRHAVYLTRRAARIDHRRV